MIRESDDIKKQLKADLRAEVVAAELLIENKELEFQFNPRSTFSRNFQKDIIREKKEIDDTGKILGYILEISRNGFYDLIPEGLFHRPVSEKKVFKKPKEMIEDSRRLKEEEESSRKFFMPIEQAFFDQRLYLEIEERKALSGFADDKQQKELINFWDLSDNFNVNQKIALMYLLPLTHKIVGDIGLTQQVFEIVLGVHTSIKLVASEYIDVGEHLPTLGEANLGLDLIAGLCFNDYHPKIRIEIGPIPKSDVIEFLPENRLILVAEELCHFFVPVDLDYEITVIVDPAGSNFQLGASNVEGRLSFTTTLELTY